jgi:hypothetical protein
MLGNLLGNVLDKLTPSCLHPLIDGGAAALEISTGDPLGAILAGERTLGDLQANPLAADEYVQVAANPLGE